MLASLWHSPTPLLEDAEEGATTRAGIPVLASLRRQTVGPWGLRRRALRQRWQSPGCEGMHPLRGEPRLGPAADG